MSTSNFCASDDEFEEEVEEEEVAQVRATAAAKPQTEPPKNNKPSFHTKPVTSRPKRK